MKNTIMSLLIVALSLMGLARASSFYEVGDIRCIYLLIHMYIHICIGSIYGSINTPSCVHFIPKLMRIQFNFVTTFYVGDSLIFQYNKDLHNLIEVSFKDYELTGHYYFICGVPGHCECGQKLEVLVMPASLQNFATTQQNNSSTSSDPKPNPIIPDPNPNPSSPNPKPKPSPRWEDPLVVLPVDAATVASLTHNAASDPYVWSGLSMLSFVLLQTLVFLLRSLCLLF
ncbi:hypothetical protein Bca52824_004068 [Brassica carinata]|uniref:Phytocyanin domain-containing protein n=1 Tax=Brassica carinata TaxID=52824 RepID=A0A8X8BFT7_BRACI|nr:hypothetical protein Bca52824_004068 [Brassica carinata]